jgi:hypothetical protein
MELPGQNEHDVGSKVTRFIQYYFYSYDTQLVYIYLGLQGSKQWFFFSGKAILPATWLLQHTTFSWTHWTSILTMKQQQ